MATLKRSRDTPMDPEPPKRHHVDVDEMEVDEPTKSNGSFKKYRVAIHTDKKILVKKYLKGDGTFSQWNVLKAKNDNEVPGEDIARFGPICDIVLKATGVDLSTVDAEKINAALTERKHGEAYVSIHVTDEQLFVNLWDTKQLKFKSWQEALKMADMKYTKGGGQCSSRLQLPSTQCHELDPSAQYPRREPHFHSSPSTHSIVKSSHHLSNTSSPGFSYPYE